MSQRPNIHKGLDSKTFRDYYYLKEELTAFCKENNIPSTGGKEEITDRIAYYLDTGKILSTKTKTKIKTDIQRISRDTIIEKEFVCSQKHREFFKQEIGKNFTFNVAFQTWLKSNSGKTYKQAIEAYHTIFEDKKRIKQR